MPKFDWNGPKRCLICDYDHFWRYEGGKNSVSRMNHPIRLLLTFLSDILVHYKY